MNNSPTIEQLKQEGDIQKCRIDELRSRYKCLGGEVTRHLETILLAASRGKSEVVVERAEILLDRIKRELEWVENA